MSPLLKTAARLLAGRTAENRDPPAQGGPEARRAHQLSLLEECLKRLSAAALPRNLKLSFSVAEAADCPDISHVELLSARFENRLYPLNIPEETFVRMWVERLASGEYTALLARAGNKLAGFVAFKGPVEEGYICALYISPLFFRKGVGRTLMELSALFCRAEGGMRLTLKVEPLNYGAISFYQSLQFRALAVKSSHLIVFQKELLPC